MQGSNRVGITGAGLVGSLWAVYLAQKGYDVDVYEGRPDMRQKQVAGGRSINLALSNRGWRALNRVNLKTAVQEFAIPMYGRMVHNESGDTDFQPYGEADQAIYSVSRSKLNELLQDEAEKHEKVQLFFNQRIEDVSLENASLTFADQDKGSSYTAGYNTIFGTDGAFSKVRESMMKTKRFNFSQSFLGHGYKELTIPPGKSHEYQLYPNALHIWPRNSFMLIALPNTDGSFTCTLFLAFEGNPGFDKLSTATEVVDFFDTYFPDAKALMPDLTQTFFENPTDSLVTIRCNPWHYKDKGCLLGDAAHAIVPFYGQGMNAGFEDCMVLSDLMNAYSDQGWGDLFKAFSDKRVKDGHAIADLALYNYIEMRDLVADNHFLEKQAISQKIYERYPDHWQPLYTMVTFSRLPYSTAKEKGDQQDQILENLFSEYSYDELCKTQVLEEAVAPHLGLALPETAKPES